MQLERRLVVYRVLAGGEVSLERSKLEAGPNLACSRLGSALACLS